MFSLGLERLAGRLLYYFNFDLIMKLEGSLFFPVDTPRILG